VVADPARRRTLFTAGRQFGGTVVLVSHDLATISTFCDRALLLEGGQVVMNDTAENVAKTYVSVSSQAAEDGSFG